MKQRLLKKQKTRKKEKDKLEERLKYNYILLSTRSKGRELIKNALLTIEQKESSENVFKTLEANMVQKPNNWVEQLESTSMQQNKDEINEYFVRLVGFSLMLRWYYVG